MAGRHDIVEVYFDAASEWRWRLKASNGRVLADSGEGYSDRAGALRALKRVLGIDVAAETTEVLVGGVRAAANGHRWFVAAGDLGPGRDVLVLELRP
jgi:uncharacterized protein